MNIVGFEMTLAKIWEFRNYINLDFNVVYNIYRY